MHRFVLLVSLMAVIAMAAVSSVKVQRMKSELDQAVQNASKLQIELGRLSEEKGQCAAELQKLTGVRSEYDQLKSELGKLEARNGNLQEQLEAQNSKMSDMQNQIEELKKSIPVNPAV